MSSIDAVFKAYDIRGRVDTGELDSELLHAVGAAFAHLTKADRIAVGFDCRPSSPGLAEALISGVVSQGSTVVALGAVPTDLVYYVSGAENIPGAMITASHNPAEYNGIKLCGPGAAPIGEDSGLATIRNMVIAGVQPSQAVGSVEPRDAVDGYIDHLFSIVDAHEIKGLDVVVDGGNGMAGVAVTRVFDRIDATLHGLYLEPDTAGVDRLDGLTMSWDDRWFNIRPSNTEPFLRLNVEASDAESVEDLVRSITEIVEGI